MAAFYEEFWFQPADIFRRLCAFLGVPWCPAFDAPAPRPAYDVHPLIKNVREIENSLAGSDYRAMLAPAHTLEDEERLVIERTTAECSTAFTSSTYFDAAESWLEQSWDATIFDLIKKFDLSICIDLAAGHGRNAERLRRHAQQIWMVDANPACVEFCRTRFGDTDGSCLFRYFANSGTDLSQIPDNSVTFVYCWDSAVHFDRLVMRRYLLEFARVLRSGGAGFIHHSNFGTRQQHSQWRANPHWRSNMSAELFREYCQAAGLTLIGQKLLDWGPWQGRACPALDCISIFRKE
jgi:ubiquinone/menaquinone biosynthesis C-methylase UbiE